MKINDTNGRFLVIIYYNKKQKHENLTSFLRRSTTIYIYI